MNSQKKLTISAAMITAAATVGILFFSVPTITGLSFADDGSTTNAAPTTTTTGSDQKTSDSSSSSSSPQTSDQPTTTTATNPPDQTPKTPDPVQKEPQKKVCNELRVDFGCNGKQKNDPTNTTKVIVVNHNHHTTKVIHDNNNSRSLTVIQQNCIAGALQLGFSSNAQNRADATYAAIVGCFGQQ